MAPVLTPDGAAVVFRSDRDGVSNLYALRLADRALLRVTNVVGGAFFPEATLARLDGASIGRAGLRVGCICVGLLFEIRSGSRRIITSPVRAITIVRASDSAVH